MSILDINLTDVPDEKPVEAGEYKVKCTKCEVKTSKQGNEMISAILQITGQVAPPIFHMIMLPKGEDEDMDRRNLSNMKQFFQAMDLPLVNPDLNHAVGKEAYAIVNLKDNDQYGPQNSVSRWVRSA